MNSNRSLLVLSLGLITAACGGGGGSSDVAPGGGPAIHGAVVKGPLQQASVTFYLLDSAGLALPGAVGSAQTLADGSFVASGLPAAPVLARTSGGFYFDESDPARQRKVALGTLQFESVVPQGATSFALTPYSMALYRKARTQFQNQGGNSYTFEEIYSATRAQAVSAFGFDPVTTIPADPLAPAGSASAQRYALYLGGAANAINAASTGGASPHLPTEADVLAFVNDFADGRLATANLANETRRFKSDNASAYAAVSGTPINEAALTPLATPANRQPRMSLPQGLESAGLVLANGAGTQTVVLSGIDAGPGEGAQALIVTASSSNPALIPVPTVSYSSPAASGSIAFTPVPGGSGSAYISVTVRDDGGTANGGSDSVTRTFLVTVGAANTAPVAASQNASVVTGGQLALTLTGTDAENSPLAYSVLSPPVHGSLSGTAPNLTYSPAAGFAGTDSFTFKVNDGTVDSAAATVTIEVAAAPNQPPTISHFAGGSIPEDQVTGTGGLDYTVSDDLTPVASLQFSATTDNPGLFASIDYTDDGDGLGNKTLTLIPAPNRNGTAQVTVTVTDAGGLSATDTFTLVVDPVNDAPIANGDSISVGEGGTASVLVGGATSVLANDTDVDSGDTPPDTLVAVLVSGPAHAAIFTLNPNGSFSYLHDNSETTTDSFTYKAVDAAGAFAIATVTISIGLVNEAPVANDDSYMVDEDTVLTGTPPGVLSNDTDPDGDGLSVAFGVGAGVGADGSFTFVPPANFHGTTSFTYRARDPSGVLSNLATVTVTVNPVNDAPNAVADTYVVDGGSRTAVAGVDGLLENDSDVEGDPLRVEVTAGPTHGTLTLTADPDGAFTGGFLYEHDGSASLADSFEYQACEIPVPPVASGLCSQPVSVDLTLQPAQASARRLIPYATGGGILRLYDSQASAADPDFSATISTARDRQYRVLYAGDGITGTVIANPHPARLVYISDGSVYAVDLGLEADHTPVQISALTNACAFAGDAMDFVDTGASILRIETGADGCGYGVQSVLIRADAATTDAGVPAGEGACCGLAALRDSAGALVATLGFEGVSNGEGGIANLALVRRDAGALGEAVEIAAYEGGYASAVNELGLGDQSVYVRGQVLNDATVTLARYDVSGSLVPDLFDYGVAGPSFASNYLDEALYDATALYFAFGNRIVRVPHGGGPGSGQEFTAPAEVVRLAQSATDLVYETRGETAGGVFGIAKTALAAGSASAAPLSEDSPEGGTVSVLAFVTNGRAHVTVHDGSFRAVEAQAIDVATGSLVHAEPDAMWVGALFGATCDFATGCDEPVDAEVVLIGAVAGGGTSLATIDLGTNPATLSPIGTLPDAPQALGTRIDGFAPYAEITARNALDQTDVYFADLGGAPVAVRGVSTGSGNDRWLSGDESALDSGGGSGPPPANDAFANATIVVDDQVVSGDSSNASREAGESLGQCQMGGRTVWFRWTPQRSGTALVDTGGSSFDTEIAVYGLQYVNDVLQRVELGCNDDAVYPSSALSFTVTAGQSYWIQLAHYASDIGGAYELHVSYDDDGDGISNQREFLLGTDSGLADSDGDGVNDDVELGYGDGDPYDYDAGSDFDPRDPNSRPVIAMNDGYAVNQGSLLATSFADGVLANDPGSGGGGSVSVYLTYPYPQQGQLDLQPDGSFTYQHSGSAAATDLFAYYTCTNDVCGDTAYVTLYVNADGATTADLGGNWRFASFNGTSGSNGAGLLNIRQDSLSFLAGDQYLYGALSSLDNLPAGDTGCIAGEKDSDVGFPVYGSQQVAGVEYGGYTWSAAADFAVTRPLLKETDGYCGFNEAPADSTNDVRKLVLSPAGDQLTFIYDDHSVMGFTRTSADPDSVFGAFLLDGSLASAAPVVFTFMPDDYGYADGRYFMVDANPNDDASENPGIEFGCYYRTGDALQYWTTETGGDCEESADSNATAGLAGLTLADEAQFVLTLPGLDFRRHGVTEATLTRLPPLDLVADQDGDGLDYYQELALGTDPADADTDRDGLSDGAEVAGGTPGVYDAGVDSSPLAADTDGDSTPDGSDPSPAGLVARPDTYVVTQGATLMTTALDGVLANDTAADGRYVSFPYYYAPVGTMTMNPDGSFTYETPSGTDAAVNIGYDLCDASQCVSGVIHIVIMQAGASASAIEGSWEFMGYAGTYGNNGGANVANFADSLSFIGGGRYVYGAHLKVFGLPPNDSGCGALSDSSDVGAATPGATGYEQTVAGVESGQYDWNPATGVFTIAQPLEVETDGYCGFNEPNGTNDVRTLVISPNGTMLTFVYDDGSLSQFSRRYSEEGTLHGAFLYSGAPNPIVFAFVPYGATEGIYMMVDADGGDGLPKDPGIEIGCYAVDGSGYWTTDVDPQTCQSVPALDTNGDAGIGGTTLADAVRIAPQGPQLLTVTVESEAATYTLARLPVVDLQGDADGDGLTYAQEVALGTDPDQADSDWDGFTDYVEVSRDGNAGNYDPGNGDTDPNDPYSYPVTEGAN